MFQSGNFAIEPNQASEAGRNLVEDSRFHFRSRLDFRLHRWNVELFPDFDLQARLLSLQSLKSPFDPRLVHIDDPGAIKDNVAVTGCGEIPYKAESEFAIRHVEVTTKVDQGLSSFECSNVNGLLGHSLFPLKVLEVGSL